MNSEQMAIQQAAAKAIEAGVHSIAQQQVMLQHLATLATDVATDSLAARWAETSGVVPKNIHAVRDTLAPMVSATLQALIAKKSVSAVARMRDDVARGLGQSLADEVWSRERHKAVNIGRARVQRSVEQDLQAQPNAGQEALVNLASYTAAPTTKHVSTEPPIVSAAEALQRINARSDGKQLPAKKGR